MIDFEQNLIEEEGVKDNDKPFHEEKNQKLSEEEGLHYSESYTWCRSVVLSQG